MLGLARLRLRIDRRRARVAADGRPTSPRASPTPRGSRSRRPPPIAHGLERVADVPIHFADPLVRRAPSLQQTADAKPPRARMNALTLAADRRRRGRAGQGDGRDAARRCSTAVVDAGGAGGRRPHRRGASVDVRPRRPVRARSPWSAPSVDTLQSLTAPVAGAARAGVAGRLDARQDRRHRGAADPRRRVPDARRAQGHRLDAGAHRPESRRAARAAAAVRRRLQADLQGDHRPDRARAALSSSSRRCWRSRRRSPRGR